ncbi:MULTISPECIES: carboxymuconolactone decarboxylase family protein [Methanothermobacter]|jgi:AhpD family alkylhydroperoxidase|uniref:AhpD family alkylhydroperoxidase n=1 Tax=Methanothermobacter defluvii TaxID=49339 RepID=A0A371NAX2_9EURY|nr:MULTISPECIES: carboxymuconolactone decarboxylase family protein [Methanothermobacter]REE25249.1 AhpD family alkylhydroperoxidase [Methanothermobacter defluvii]WBF08214.1 carboxymuconolactone decarboxylase family protein [Methanothermobacter thermautotrophicus]
MEKILEKIEEFFGFIPEIFKVLEDEPEILEAYYDKMEKILSNDALPLVTKELIGIGAAAALGSEHCLKTHIKAAKRLDAGGDEILLAILIGASMAESTALSRSLRVFKEERMDL